MQARMADGYLRAHVLQAAFWEAAQTHGSRLRLLTVTSSIMSNRKGTQRQRHIINIEGGTIHSNAIQYPPAKALHLGLRSSRVIHANFLSAREELTALSPSLWR